MCGYRIGREGNSIVVGRGAPYFLRENPYAFHVFLYAPRAEKIRRTMAAGHTAEQAEELVDFVDRERIAYVTRGDLWVADADGTRLGLLERNADNPAWAPNGRSVVLPQPCRRTASFAS